MPEVVHIVLVQWRHAAPLDQLEALVDKMASGIPGILSVVHGASASPEQLEAGYDWALVVTFADTAARDGYLPHELHAPVAAFIGKWSERLVVFDVAA